MKATLNDWHVPCAERDAIPLVATQTQIACLPGWGVDDSLRPAPDAVRVVQLEIRFEEMDQQRAQ